MQTPIAVTIPDAVKVSGTSRTSIYKALKRGDLTARKAGRRTLISFADLEAYLASLPSCHRTSRIAFYRKVASGRLRIVKIGNTHRVTHTSVEAPHLPGTRCPVCACSAFSTRTPTPRLARQIATSAMLALFNHLVWALLRCVVAVAVANVSGLSLPWWHPSSVLQLAAHKSPEFRAPPPARALLGSLYANMAAFLQKRQ